MVDRAAELQEKWEVERGQIWEIGRHRLMCGDSTSQAEVARLLNGGTLQALVTSPPYGVGMEYEGNAGQTETLELAEKVFAVWCKPIVENGFVFVNFGDRWTWPLPMSSLYHRLFTALGLRWYDQRFWKRSHVALAIWNTTQPHAMSHIEHLYTFQKGTGAYPVNDLEISKEGLWEDEGSSAGVGHPAVMASGVAGKAIRIYSQSGDSIGEPFIGSGTTMAVSEQTDRICYGMEIEPKYCAVTLERLSALGLTSKLVDNV